MSIRVSGGRGRRERSNWRRRPRLEGKKKKNQEEWGRGEPRLTFLRKTATWGVRHGGRRGERRRQTPDFSSPVRRTGRARHPRRAALEQGSVRTRSRPGGEGGTRTGCHPQPPARPAVPPGQRGGVPEEGDRVPPPAPSLSALAGRVFIVAGVERARSHDRAMRARQVYPEEEGLAGCSPRDAPHHSFYKRGEEFDRLANIPGADYKTNHPGSIPQTAPAPALGELDACLGRAAIAGSCR